MSELKTYDELLRHIRKVWFGRGGNPFEVTNMPDKNSTLGTPGWHRAWDDIIIVASQVIGR